MAGKSAIAGFLASLPGERRKAVERVRKTIRRHLPAGYEETITKGMLIYQVPLAVYPDTYNGQPLWYVALASQKSYLSLHLVAVYMNKKLATRLQDGFRAANKKLDMGKACIRFQRAEDLALEVIGEIVASTPRDRWIAIAQAARKR